MNLKKTVLPAGITAIAQRFRQESRKLPPGAWTRWWKTLAIGLGISALIAFGMTLIAMRHVDAGLQAWDETWLLKMQDYSPLSFSKGVTWESPGNLVGMLPVFFTFTALTAWFRKPIVAATVVATYIGQFALVWISWGMWSRDRPNLIADGIAAPSLHSFPSGHVVVAVTMYGLLFYLWFCASRNLVEKAITFLFALVWIGLISLSRLALGAHWPSDVLASWMVGLLWLTTVTVAMRRALRGSKGQSARSATADS